jgi:hypothetical protein
MAQLVAVENLMIIEASIFRDLGAEGRAMAIKRKASFNPKAFLAKVGEGWSIGAYRKDHIVFSQGDRADAIATVSRDRADGRSDCGILRRSEIGMVIVPAGERLIFCECRSSSRQNRSSCQDYCPDGLHGLPLLKGNA